MRKPCSIESCGQPHFGRGYCQRHYRNWRDSGNPIPTKELSDIEFIRRRGYTEEGDCHVYAGTYKGLGYGLVRGKAAHRIVWADAYGPIPEGLIVRHRCDNPPCIRLEHLLIGTQRDNAIDMLERGRHNSQKKETQ